jgi:hypothetical protein
MGVGRGRGVRWKLPSRVPQPEDLIEPADSNFAVGQGTSGGRVRVYASRPPHRTPGRGSADPVSRQ